MKWTWIHSAYLLVAAAHPITELIRGIDLRTFLNRDYYQTGREDFPVSRERGVEGSLLVLVLLILPLAAIPFPSLFPILWCLAAGLAVADLIQHVTHFALGQRKTAPFVHLLTILFVCGFLWRIPPKMGDLSGFEYLWASLALLVGALLIFGNWGRNSRLANPSPRHAVS